MKLSSIVHAGEKALDAVSESFSPSKGATSLQIRKNRLLCIGISIFCFALGGLFIFTMRSQPPAVAMLPVLLGYAFIVTGAYRTAFGKNPEPDHPGEVSFKRIAFAIR